MLIAKDGATALDTLCEVKQEHDVVLLSSIAILRPDPTQITTSYLRYFLEAPQTRAYMKGGFITGAAIPRVVLKDFKRCVVRLPDLGVQRRVTAILSGYDDLIENNARRIKILEEMAQRTYREWFVHFRFPSHERVRMAESEMGPIPDGWTLGRLGAVVEVNSRCISSASPPGEIDYVDIASVSRGQIERIEHFPFKEAPGRARRIVRHGDVIWSTVRPNRRSYALVLHPPESLVVSTGFAVLSPSAVPYSYLYLATTTDEFAHYLTNRATGSAYPAVRPNDFDQAPILLPAKSLLDRFHEITAEVFGLRHCLLLRNRNLRQTRDLLLPKLISGPISLPHSEKEAIAGDV